MAHLPYVLILTGLGKANKQVTPKASVAMKVSMQVHTTRGRCGVYPEASQKRETATLGKNMWCFFFHVTSIAAAHGFSRQTLLV